MNSPSDVLGRCLIEVCNVSKYYGKTTGVCDLSFQVREGDVFALLGPNGAGKSTTIKLMTTMTKPSAGQITVSDADTVTASARVRRNIGVVFQSNTLDDDLTVEANLWLHAAMYNLSRGAAANRIDYLLQLADIGALRGRIVKTLSGGTKRRLELIRALLHRPRIIFLDEPTVGLDPEVRNAIWSHLAYLNRSERLTIFFTTHYMEEVEKHAKTAAIINHGKLAGSGAVETFAMERGCRSFEEAYLSVIGAPAGLQ